MSQDECARANVVVLREAGFSYSRIAAVTGKSISFVQRWVERKRATGGVKRKSCAGRPKKLTSNVLHEIKKSMKSKATGSIRRTQRKLESMDIRVSKSSISRSIKILGLKRVKDRKRPKLTPAHHEQRVDFANAHVNRSHSAETGLWIRRNIERCWPRGNTSRVSGRNELGVSTRWSSLSHLQQYPEMAR